MYKIMFGKLKRIDSIVVLARPTIKTIKYEINVKNSKVSQIRLYIGILLEANDNNYKIKI